MEFVLLSHLHKHSFCRIGDLDFGKRIFFFLPEERMELLTVFDFNLK